MEKKVLEKQYLKSNTRELNKELVKLRHVKDQTTIQQVRKKMSASSRFLDGYYNSNMHNKPFFGGKSKEKVSYVFDSSGLAHNYNSSVPQKLHISEKSKRITTEKYYEEFKNLEENEIMITIEHCSNCHEHITHTQHINNIYLKFARSLQKCILLRYPFMRVLLKPIETDIVSTKKSKCIFII